MRDDSRPQDAFSWTRPWVPYGDDPFVWHDPAEDFRTPVAANDGPTEPAVAEAELAQDNSPMIAPVTEGGDDMWVELPALDDKPKKTRARRGRGRGRSEEADVAEAPAAAEEAPDLVAVIEEAAAPIPEPVVEAEAPAPAKRSRARKPKAEAVVAEAPAAEPAMEAVAEPVVEAPPAKPARASKAKAPSAADPAEISTPPAAPRKGWWRRG